MQRQCSTPDCERPHYARGLCQPHYMRWYQAEGREAPKQHQIHRNRPLAFWSRVEFTPTCWLWRGSVGPNGYGYFGTRRDHHLAHRWAYTFCVGPIVAGLSLDHLCRVRHCVNPSHLEPVTQHENCLRGAKSQQTHCKRGHPLSCDNVRIETPRGRAPRRQCRACGALRARRKAAILASGIL